MALDEKISLNIDKKDFIKIVKICKELDINVSQFVRKAIKIKLNELHR